MNVDEMKNNFTILAFSFSTADICGFDSANID